MFENYASIVDNILAMSLGETYMKKISMSLS
jgi:hypothetical protein